MNELRVERWVLEVDEGEDDPLWPVDVVVPVVDGVPLGEVFVERGPGIAFDVAAGGQWLGRPTYAAAGRVVVLDGTCGIADCCGVAARIDLRDDVVVWHDFFARGHPPLPPGVRFTFARPAYEATLATIPELVPRAR